MKSYHLLLPTKLKGWLKKTKEDPPDITGFTISRLEYLISEIVKHKQEKHPGAYSLLNMEYLRNIVPKAGDYLNLLKDQQVIEWVNHCDGRNSRMYRLTAKYDGATEYRTLTDQRLTRRIERAYSQMKLRNSKKYPQLNRYVYSVSIDTAAALHTIEDTYKYNLKDDKPKAEARRTFSLAEVDKIKEGRIYIKVNPTNFRYDTNFTRLPGELVQHLSIDGYPLTELDIVNSQPFIAASLFDMTPEVEAVVSKFLGHFLTMYIKSLHLSEYEDVKLYRLMVTNGEFYEYMMRRFDETGIVYKDRVDAKEQIFTIFFGKNSAIHYSPTVRLFKAEFPNIYKVFEAIKEKAHNRLPILLQRIESHLMLDCVAQKILTELPEVKFITKHDSLLPSSFMIAGKTAEVEKLLPDIIEKIIGIRPTLKVKQPDPIFSYFNSYLSLSTHYVYQNPVTN